MNKRGVFFSSDAIVALMIIIVVVLMFFPVMNTGIRKTELHYDVITTLSALKIGEINNSYVKGLIANGKIDDLNRSVLEQIGDFYSENVTNAQILARAVLSNVNSSENIGIWYGDDLIASLNKTDYGSAKSVDVARQTISGIKKGSPSRGYISKAWLKKISSKRTSTIVKGDLICGGWHSFTGGTEYCGNEITNITYRFAIPLNSTILSAIWLAEPSWVNQPTTLYVNGARVYSGTIQYYQSINITQYIHAGNNSAILYSAQGGEDGASHITVQYLTPDLQTFELSNKTYFNEVSSVSVLYHEKSILVSQPIKDMSVVLNVSKKTSLQIRKGAQLVNVSTKNPIAGYVSFSDSEIKSALASAGLSYGNLVGEYLFFIVKEGVDQTGQNIVLGRNSYVQIDYSSSIDIPFGSIDLTDETKIASYSNQLQGTFYRNIIWKFNLPLSSIPVLADWQFGWLSTSGGGTTSQNASANNIVLYKSPPSPYISAFSRFGYTPSRASGILRDGVNNFSLQFGSNYGVSINASYGYFTYFMKSYVNYGDTKDKAKGGKRTVLFEDGTSINITVGDASDPWDPAIDSIDDAVERLLAQMDADGNGKIELKLAQDNFEIESLDISNVPYLWSTEVQVRTWN